MRSGRDLIKEIRAKVKEVDPSEVHDLQARNGEEPDLVVVDVREQGEWDQGHIPGAIHVPRSYLEIAVRELRSGARQEDRALLRDRTALCARREHDSKRRWATRTWPR